MLEELTMSNQNFSTSFTVDKTPEEAFKAIKNIRGWWSEEIEGPTDTVGDAFDYHYKDIHRCSMKMTEAVPGKRVAWLVTDNYFNFTEDKTEWKGTQIVFDMARKGDKTEVRFTHLGLVPEYGCFETCSTSWGSYINGSLKSLIATGKGHPNQKE
jgi:hypothetical protein